MGSPARMRFPSLPAAVMRARQVAQKKAPVTQPSEVVAERGAFWPRAALACALWAVFIAPVVLFGHLSRYAQNPDPFIYGQVAKEMLAGKRLFVETWESKPPLAYVAYALPQMIVPRSYTAICIFAGLCVALASALYAYVFRNNRAAMLGVALFLSLFPMAHWDYAWPSTEVFSNVFVAGALLIGYTIHREGRFSLAQCACVGVLACLAFHVRQNTVACAAIPALAIWEARQSRPAALLWALGAMLLGALLTWGAILGLVLWVGDVRMYFWTVFVYSRMYASVGSPTDLFKLWLHLSHSPLLIILVVFTFLAASRRRDLLFVVATAAIGLLAASAPVRPFFHYWVCAFPYVALLMGMGIEALSEATPRLAQLVTGALALFLLQLSVTMVINGNLSFSRYGSFVDLAKNVESLAPEDATLLVCGPLTISTPAVQFASRLRPAHMFEWTMQFKEPWVKILPVPFDEVLAQYVENPPDVIVASRDMLKLAFVNPEPPEMPGDLRLLRALNKEHRYRVRGEQSVFAIMLRDPSPK